MRITQWGEYGLLCSMHIAQRSDEGESTVGAAEIAEVQGIALQYAQQILQRLRKGDIIDSVRGPHGGYKLSRPASEISLGEILLAAEGSTFEVICDSKPVDPEGRCRTDHACGLRDLWRELADHVDAFLNGRSLADLVKDHLQSTALIQLKHTEPSSLESGSSIEQQ
ncbi:MAG: Rrf2 family transcriptional regulator [Bdellovibrionales bacterium]|nr:Rrf2 family transcriptional regulator [Bdellovibrionales bacterium]